MLESTAHSLTAPIRRSLLQTYPRGHVTLEAAIIEAGPPGVTDLEVHADRLRLRAPTGVTEIPFDISGLTTTQGDYDFVPDAADQAMLMVAADRQSEVLAVLRPHYWLVLGVEEAGVSPLLFGTREVRQLLGEILEKPGLAAFHRHVAGIAQALDEGRRPSTTELLESLHDICHGLRDSGTEPELRSTLEATLAIRGVRPVLAIRRAARAMILHRLGLDDAASLRETLMQPRNLPRLTRSHGITAETLKELDRGRMLDLVDELREFEFLDLFLIHRTARPGTIGEVLSRHGLPASTVTTPDSLRETITMARSISPISSYLFAHERKRRALADPDATQPVRRGRPAGFFPGLGSRAAYQDLGRGLFDSGIPEVTEIYETGARALGFDDPARILLEPANLPTGRMARQGFIGAAFVVHNLALEAQLRALAHDHGVPLGFVAYTGESFGIIAAAIAAGSLSVGDGIKIAQAFTPLVLVAAEGADDEPFAQQMTAYLPQAEPLVPEPFHVMGLQGDPDRLTDVLREIQETWSADDVEVHKLYSARQANVYVRGGAKTKFEEFVAEFPAVQAVELKDPTTFLAHSARMRGVRAALDRFISAQGIVFRKPRVPVVSNSTAGLLTTAAEVHDAVLATIDEVMASQATAETLDALRPDLIIELGLGHKSVRLLKDNNLETPVLAFTGDGQETKEFFDALQLVDHVLAELTELTAGDHLSDRHHDLLRDLFRVVAANQFAQPYLASTMERVITQEMLNSERRDIEAVGRFLEIFQHTSAHRDSIDVASGELVLQARLKKRIVGPAEQLGQVYAELTVLDATGCISSRSLLAGKQPEVVVVHFDRPADLDPVDLARRTRLLLDTQPLARQIYAQVPEVTPEATGGEDLELALLVHQFTLFHVLHRHRPAMFAQTDYYLEGSDPMGWLVALAASGATTLARIVRVYRALLRGETGMALDDLLASLQNAVVPVLSPEGIPVQNVKDLEAASHVTIH
ncbi:hypothetical protein ACFVWG_38265 [Kribbella sp. NPDC058245]|uniref:hypothetical protein n=1 Tax=Kribbella sp. NPDC058245 TaxID=3346399 RepID=UPI0036E90CBB